MNFKVIIPTHNAADYLDLCLYSLKKYSVWNHEYYIILDDCSDHTMDICKKYDVYSASVCFNSPYKTRNYIKNILDLDEDFYLFMTADDMFASPNWDESIFKHYCQDTDVVWSSQLTDYLLKNTFNEIKKHKPDFTLDRFVNDWALGGIHVDFYECGITVNTFNEEVFLKKYHELSTPKSAYGIMVKNENGDISQALLCNTNFLIHSSFWNDLNGWPTTNTYPCDPLLGKANDILFQEKISKVGRNIIAKDVIFFHFGGRNINRDDKKCI
jgi:glycosyltransferase involved in cell wall biosynthesis